MLRMLSAIGIIILSGTLSHASSLNIEAGPIWNQHDASRKCPELARTARGSWTGHWWTTIPGKMSVCQIKVSREQHVAQPTLLTSDTTAFATTNLNVRSGPGVRYPKIAALAPREPVAVNQCTNSGWCTIGFRGRAGWVSGKYLAAVATGARTPVVAPRPSVVISEPPVREIEVYEAPQIIVVEPDEPEVIFVEPDEPELLIIEEDEEIIFFD